MLFLHVPERLFAKSRVTSGCRVLSRCTIVIFAFVTRVESLDGRAHTEKKSRRNSQIETASLFRETLSGFRLIASHGRAISLPSSLSLPFAVFSASRLQIRETPADRPLRVSEKFRDKSAIGGSPLPGREGRSAGLEGLRLRGKKGVSNHQQLFGIPAYNERAPAD